MRSLHTRTAYAKINLHLSVGAPYEDGYHPIESIFSLIDLSDTITLSAKKSEQFSVSVTGLEAYCAPGNDTLTKAAQLWYGKSQLPLSLEIHCEKHIPVQAGLGGGSSDAAAVLCLLQEVAQEQALSEAGLADVALQVGCDVPFFLSGHSCALVEGRGERIRPLPLDQKHLLVVQPVGYAISTKEAYGRLDSLMESGGLPARVSLQRVIATLAQKSSTWGNVFFNDFGYCVSFERFYESLVDLSNGKAGYGSLSGSGSCWYFISEDERSVVELHRELHTRYLDTVQLWCTTLI